MVNLWLMYAPIIIILAVMAFIGLRGARKVRKDISELVRPKEEREEEAR